MPAARRTTRLASPRPHARGTTPAPRADPALFRTAVGNHLLYTCVKRAKQVVAVDLYRAMAHAVRDQLVQRWLDTQQTHARWRLAQALYGAADFEPFSAIHLARHRQIAQINFVAAARQTDRQGPVLHALGAQERQHARHFATILVAVGDQQDLFLASIARLRQCGLQRRLDIGFLAVHARRKLAVVNLSARQKFPFRHTAEGE